MANKLHLTQINGVNPLKFVTTDATSKVLATFDFTALSIPYDKGATSMTSTDVNTAIQEVWNLAGLSGFTNPFMADLAIANTFVLKAQNGIGSLNLRDTANNFVTLLGGTKRLAFTTDYWGISDTATFTNTDNYIRSNSSLQIAKWNTTLTKFELRQDGVGLGITFDKTSQEVNIWGRYNGVFSPVIAYAENSGSSYTTSNDTKPISGLSAKGTTFNSGISNSVALGGDTYTVNLSNTAFANAFALASGINHIVFSGTISANSAITVPNKNGTLTLRATLSDTKISRWNNTLGQLVDGILIDDGTRLGIGVTTALKTFTIQAGAGDEAGIYVTQLGTAGFPQIGGEFNSLGAATTNMAVKLSAANASFNYALYVVSGDILAQQSSTLAIGGTNAVLANQLVRFDSIFSATGLLVNQGFATGTVYGQQTIVTGASTNNIGQSITVSGASTSNVGLSIAATGTGALGLRLTAGSLLVGNATLSSASVSAEFVGDNKAVLVNKSPDPSTTIISPIAGMIMYNTTSNKHQGYDGTVWRDLY